ncbi:MULTISPECIES: SDR family oxidoreductase [Bosea]|uniref:SDR family oxidoreductase n=1 Tax=Bosea TaxID=85413 RepID=UPI00214F91D2|nr:MULTISPECIES: SDR family oxidoreductase [Bosea]MCR4524737.1 SDR family oxidoreductase [Bosea sp. 47.2.35]MDR6831684.1 NAD(P)-dependent dehydrogenase (short-subunit alcohol dehydrogenase family) [Bosea robiniae]MDR6898390.1 NAD(P)-dependent dehydrogenase (short-subunit alcohol dehydrogenase family) [Bosea sp. BE109]MDR7141787.1 NAD(P)-dependent dehydrogenase (short-subunit alcohol dehydrogenase family) [Bosea sp. BE168]MDR7178401.1 NAD(P)-dependent dehydrogenase (short-subunit alcohol dehydr
MGKTVLVTGAASGFGRGVALGLAWRGHRVIAGCQIWPQVWELRNAARDAEVGMEVIKLDVLNGIDRSKALGLEIDVLFNNAGIMESGPIVEIPISVFRSVFETNVFAALELAQGFARAMVKRGAGRIVWTSSVAGLVKVPFDGAYAASKHAVEGICSAMHEELKPYGVQVVTVNPGAFRTGFNDTGMESMDQWWDHGERVVAHWPVRALDRQHDPAEMIEAIIGVIEADDPPYRTVRPAGAEEMVRKEQAEIWDRRA